MNKAPVGNDATNRVMNRVRITTRVMRAIAAIIAGVAVTWIGVYSYSFIARTNLRAMPEVPWGAGLAIVLLARHRYAHRPVTS